MIEIYNSNDKERLKSSVDLNWDLIKSTQEKSDQEDDDVFIFSNEVVNNTLENEIKDIADDENIFTIDEDIDIVDI